MKIMVYEYFAAGGFLQPPAAQDLFEMGWAMLSASIEDGLGAGHQVYTLVDSRIQRSLPGNCAIKRVGEGRVLSVFRRVLSEVDAVLLIAPETHGLLGQLTSLVEQSDKLLLGSATEGIRLAGDKYETYLVLHRNGFRVPRTRLWAVPFKDWQGPGPRILKPRRGAGCEGVYLTKTPGRLRAGTTGGEEYLIQEYVPGTPASVAMIVGKKNTLVLSVNGQKIAPGSPLRYAGGTIPLVHPMSPRAAACAAAIPPALPGLRGYVGVDMVLTPDEVYVVEVNPRITFTYCGLRRCISTNLMKIIIDAAMGLELDDQVPLTAAVQFDALGHVSVEEDIG